MKLLILLLFLVFISCNKNENSKKSTNEENKVTALNKSADSSKNSNNTVRDSASGSSSLIIRSMDLKEVSILPEDIKYEGTIVAGAKWEDKLGANALIITETQLKSSGEKRSKGLYAYHFIIDGKNNRQLWKVNDYIRNCEFDVTLEHIKNSLAITDLDGNGIGESTFMYMMSCRSDVSPNDLKLIMHEGDKKYAIRGNTVITIPGDKTYGGERNIDKSFETAPRVFLDFARKQWNTFQTEKIN